MVTVLAGLALAAYVAAGLLLWFDRSFRPLLLLLAGSVATWTQPLWVRLFDSPLDVPGNVVRVGSLVTLPFWTLLGGGVILALPPLIIMYGLRHHWWNQHYASAWGFFLAFILFFLIFDALEARSNITLFVRPQLPRDGTVEAVFRAVLLASISFGLLYAFVATRHYSLQIALVPLLVSGLATSLLLIGILCSPYWFAQLRDQSNRVLAAGAIVSLALVLWAIHLLASGLHAGRWQRLQWR